ncbi:LppX_LprAFG lipoprotein [Rhizohabitans arisaemae]|uniref:LppX_LprAFG lipoprotein n=1 Tax=Rhizohabitans arisaemae TaxID=2720610 RepID=UPI0024B0B39C|nr:LppX_LprAFG lipoprotein [Rhizohabitans arisaemae]
MSLRRVRVLVPLFLATALVSGCTTSSAAPGGSLPEAPELIREAVTALGQVRSVAFAVETEGSPPIPIRQARGKLLKSGDAEGTLQMEQGGQRVEFAFTVLGDTVYLKGLTGGYQKLPRAAVAAIYDPTALLDPETGVAKVLSTATDVQTEAREQVNGEDAYRVKVNIPKGVVSSVVPGVTAAVNGQIWLSAANKRPLKALLPLTGGKVAVTLSDYDAVPPIKPPAT